MGTAGLALEEGSTKLAGLPLVPLGGLFSTLFSLYNNPNGWHFLSQRWPLPMSHCYLAQDKQGRCDIPLHTCEE
jgi:hypothetical protein